ncbi:MAG TPA: hypothetical protein VJ624_03670 [Thermodesulfobacteriota bacterium]|nr:hypothetical protein [Thermodesulfobacteriota bacterium]
MKKFFFTVIIVLAFLIVGGIMVGDFVLEKVSSKALEYLVTEGKTRGINVDFARFGDVGLNGFSAVRWRKFVAVINAPRYIALAPGEDIVVSIEEINLGLTRLLKGVAAISAHDIALRVEGGLSSKGTPGEPQEGLNNGELRVEFPLKGGEKGISAIALAEIPKRLLQFLQQGTTQIPFDFRAESTFKIGGSAVKADITTKMENSCYFLVMSPDDVRRISKRLNEELTETEISLVSTHPFLAPSLFKIRDYARTQSEAAYAKDATVSEDAYRHVLWSFLLTKEFGPEFARHVTDAHEIGAVKPNTEADHKMDYNNNKVGRDYAKAGYAEDLILELVMTDPQVIRIPQQ